MKLFASTVLLLFVAVQAAGQVRQEPEKKQDSSDTKTEAPSISIDLVGGGRL